MLVATIANEDIKYYVGHKLPLEIQFYLQFYLT